VILRYCKETNATLLDAYDTPIRLILYIASYGVLLDEEQKKQYEKMSKRLRKH
jgi:hypothetical protein